MAVVGVALLVAAGTAWGQHNPAETVPFDHWAYDPAPTLADLGIRPYYFFEWGSIGHLRSWQSSTPGAAAEGVWKALGYLARPEGAPPSFAAAQARLKGDRHLAQGKAAALAEEVEVVRSVLEAEKGPEAVQRALAAIPPGCWFYAEAQALLLQARPNEVMPFDNWAYDAVQALVDRGFVEGIHPDGFQHYHAPTRAEIAEWVWKALGNLNRKPLDYRVTPPAPTEAAARDTAVILAKLVEEFWPEMDLGRASAGRETVRKRLAAVPEGQWFYARAHALLLQARPNEVVPFDNWAYDAVQKLVDFGIVIGYPDATFRGNPAATRGEFASIVWRLLDNLNRKLPKTQGGLTEGPPGPEGGGVSAPEIAVILAKLVQEFWPEMDFAKAAEGPGAVRKRLAAVPEGHWFHAWAQKLVKDGGQPAGAMGYFPDVPTDHWAAAAVARVWEAGIMEGYPGGEFGGE
jgi:hypothetical protein